MRGDVEIIFVNDASTDGTSDILEKIACDRGGLIVNSNGNKGQGAARNLGVAKASGDYFLFLDSDDELISPDFYLESLKLMQEAGYKAAKGYMQFFDPVKGYVLNKQDPRYNSVVMSSACGMVVSRDIFLKMGGFPESSVFRGKFGGEDVAFMQLLSKFVPDIAKVPLDAYKVWSRTGSHLDIFLSQTRIVATEFEFVGIQADQQSEYVKLSAEIDKYVKANFRG